MKNLFKTLLVLAFLLIAHTVNASVNQEGGLIRNVEEVDGLVVTETVFKMEEGALKYYMKHLYKYDADKQRIEDEAMKWNGTKDTWEKDLCIRYTYNGNSITTEYYKWNKKKKDYVIVPEMTVTMDR